MPATLTTWVPPRLDFRSLTEVINTTTLGSQLVFRLFVARGQFERDLIRERTQAHR
ncbi:hypothetical protein SAMN02927895_05198 [Belnapia rosea]|uniref:recombinase family protein n=1 Tax=Belnapia rosea TaxID=938405 RepID=UPI00088F0C0C|nr:hypothetical protein SAMN02927895_05198 [Belnapia rosea]